MLRNNELKKLKSILYLNDKVQDLKFQVICKSFNEGDSEIMEAGVKLDLIEKGVNSQGLRYLSFLGEMPEGSSFPRNQHSDAYEVFTCIKGVIKETVSSTKMESGKSFTFRPRAHHGFKALKKSTFFCVITEIHKD